jgi:hypothetical protein
VREPLDRVARARQDRDADLGEDLLAGRRGRGDQLRARPREAVPGLEVIVDRDPRATDDEVAIGLIDVDVLAADWGFYTTATDNLERLPALVSDLDPKVGSRLTPAAEELRQAAADAPKSRAFNLRAKVGRRKRWYELPDESLT